MNKLEFIHFIYPHAATAIGHQHGWLVRWAIAKAAQECGWSINNVLIQQCNNCLGIKAGVWDERKGMWRVFRGIKPNDVVWLQDSIADGRDDGGAYSVPWRKFKSLVECFAEFVRMLNDRDPYTPWRNSVVGDFENVYSASTEGHALEVLENIHAVTAEMQEAGIVDSKGRIFHKLTLA